MLFQNHLKFLFRHLLKTSLGWFFRMKSVILEAHYPTVPSPRWNIKRLRLCTPVTHNSQSSVIVEKEEWLHGVRMLYPAVYKALIWEVEGKGMVRDGFWPISEFRNNQPFIQLITEKYVNKKHKKKCIHIT